MKIILNNKTIYNRQVYKKRANNKKIIVSIICAILLLSVQTINVYSATYTLNITKKSQSKSNWCWAACAQMVGNYYSKSKTQKEICKKVKGKVINEKASLNEIKKAIEYASSHKVEKTNTIGFQFMAGELRNKRPVVIRVGWRSGGGHVYVVKGVVEKGGSVPHNYELLIDPISGVPNRLYEHIKIVAGTQFDSGYGEYTDTFEIIN